MCSDLRSAEVLHQAQHLTFAARLLGQLQLAYMPMASRKTASPLLMQDKELKRLCLTSWSP